MKIVEITELNDNLKLVKDVSDDNVVWNIEIGSYKLTCADIWEALNIYSGVLTIIRNLHRLYKTEERRKKWK